MAYDRDDSRNRPYGRDRGPGRDPYSRDERWGSGDRYRDYERGRRDDDRGFFERAGDEIASWFGGEDDDRSRERGWRRDDFQRGRGEPWGGGGQFDLGRDRGYRPMAGDYGRSETLSGRGEDTRQRQQRWGERSAQGIHDPHYHSMRQRHLDELDRDYDEYRRENQSRFESEFGSWRERRMGKRQLLVSVREHMEVVGNDDQHVGTVDRVAGDRIILAKSDEAAGGAHHSLSCADVDRIEENRVILECNADEAKNRWRDENRSRALFEREDQGEVGPRILDRSFEGTY